MREYKGFVITCHGPEVYYKEYKAEYNMPKSNIVIKASTIKEVKRIIDILDKS